MLIKTLAENIAISEDFGCEHGLSLYIETKEHKILFDVGASELFLRNAEKLNVNIADVDFLINFSWPLRPWRRPESFF